MKNFGKTTDIKDIITVGYEANNAVLYSTSQSLTNNQKAQARTNIGAGTSSFDGNYNSLSNKPSIPTKTSQLNNDSNFATTSQVEAKYTKPAGGIPKTDLATAVQNSLTAADNAVKYTSQSLTDAQKVQARTNIGAGTSNFSGSYNDLTNRPTIPAAVSIVQSTGTSTSSVMSQKATTDAVNGRLSKTDNTNIEVLGTKKATTTLGGNQLYAPDGIIFGGTAAAAGLVTRGICGVSTPSVGGACTKENLYINYDGNNDFNAGRQIVLNAGTTGNHLGSNMYQYTVPRGDIVKNWVEAKGYATSVKVNGNTIASSGGVVDIGNVIKSHQSLDGKQDKITSSNKLAASLVSGLANVATSGSYNDLSNTPTIPAAANNGTLTIQKNGTNVATFGANQSTNATANITVPTKVSEITNDSGFITSDGSVKSVIDYNDTSKKIKIGYTGTGIFGDGIKYIAGYTAGDSESEAKIKDISKDALKSWLGYAAVATSGSYNDLSDKPSFDKLTRIQKQGYAGDNNAIQYFKLASFPVYNGSGNYASFIVTGRMGGWEAGNMSFVNMILYNRGAEGGGYINVDNSSFYNLCDVVMYRETSGASTAYLKVKGYYTFDININSFQATNAYTGTAVTPTGTLKWTASTQADRLAVSDGVAYVNGFTLPKQVQINGTTVNPNSAGLINLGSGFATTDKLPTFSLSGTTLTITL